MSIDKVLQLLAEGKSIEKIAAQAGASYDDVVSLIFEAREIVNRKDQARARKKVKLRKKVQENEGETPSIQTDDLFKGADLSVVPLEDTLQFYIAARKIVHAVAVGIIICDGEGRQVGTIHYNESGEHVLPKIAAAMERCVRIAAYFKARRVRIKIDNEFLYNMYHGRIIEPDPVSETHLKRVRAAAPGYRELLVELIDSYNNQKAAFLTERER
ncbi:MAG: hypothetical protein ACOCWH_03135 [Spirochaetota bacterium]